MNALLDSLQTENESLLDVTLTITAYNYLDDDNYKKSVRRAIMTGNFKPSNLYGLQIEGFKSSAISPVSTIKKYERGINSSSLAAVFPFVRTFVMDDGGIMLGENKANGFPFIFNMWKRGNLYQNSNGMIIGKSGSGKSFFLKSLIANEWANDTRVIILDPEAEYLTLTKNLSGNLIDVGNAKEGRINPFHIYKILTEDGLPADPVVTFNTHLKMLESFFKIVFVGANSDVIELINNLAVEAYARKGIYETTDCTGLNAEDFPLFNDLLAVLREKNKEETDSLTLRDMRTAELYLQKFVSGRYSDIWNAPSTLKVNADLIDFNFQSLFANKNNTVANAQMLLVFRFIEQEVINAREANKSGKNLRTLIIADEAHLFIDAKFPIALDFFFSMSKRIRKYNGSFIPATQNIADWNANEELRSKTSAILKNSQYTFMKAPGSSSYANMGTSTTVSSTGTNGLYYFYVKDKAGNTSRTYYLYLDTVKPTGTIKNSSGTAITGSYTNQTFSYSATDSGSGISYLQYKKPGSSSWLTYTSGTSISASATSGTYQFRAVDNAWNISATKSITLDSSKPTMTLYSETTSVSNGFKSIANYIKATATDSGSGVKTIYVKKPGAASYTEYASGTQLTADGAYSFYCVDNAGNASQTYTISMDHTRPTITSSVGGFGKTLKDGFTVTASDNYSGVTLYYKTPNSNSFVASTTSSVVFSKTAVNGTYGFYAVDGFGNRSDTCYMYMSIDAPEATIVKSDNSHKVCVIWTASNCYATLNGKSYTSGTWIEQEGEYTFIITNDANRSTTYKFTVDHYYARYSMVAPTCTQKGYTIYKCTGCGDSYNGDFIEAKGHDYESKIVKPTCTAQGYTRYTCKTCGNTYSDNFVEAEGHQYGEWTTVKEPTCVDLGKDERTCSVCSYVDERDTDALGHSYKDIVVDPSCTDRGNTIHECERCGHTYTDSYTDATGHDFGEWTSLTKPTCTASGVDQRKCTSCPQTETKIVSPLGHNYKAEVVEPTCLEQGYTTHTCSRCGTGYNDTFVSPLGHDYEEIEVAPTCTEEGYRGKKCRRCEDCVKTEILKAVGHKFTDSYFIATCEEEGYTLHTCLSCGNEYKDNIVLATGHDYETEVVREPHCETEGERKFHCTKCEKEYYSEIPATGHNYELTGTEEVNGENIRTYVCTNCGAITTQNMGEQYEQVSSYIGYLFGQYQPYMWWVLLATAGVWSIVMGIFFAIAQKNEDKEKARKMIKNYVIGLVVIFAILVACPYLVKGIAALIAG